MIIELLESRIAPANFIVSVVGPTLHVTGDDAINVLDINGVAGSPSTFVLSVPAADTINGAPGPFTTPAGIASISIKMLGGDDNVNLGQGFPVHLKGDLRILGGGGANDVTAKRLTVDKSVVVINGAHATGSNQTFFEDVTIGGAITVRNGDGDTETGIYRAAAGTSCVQGNVTVHNGTGRDSSYILDTNIGGNFTVKNGHADVNGSAGYTEIYNIYNTSFRSVIRGSISISYLDGMVDYDGIWDTEILGNVTFNYGAAKSELFLDGYAVALPTVIRGHLTITGTGGQIIDIGLQYRATGLIVGKNFTLTGGAAGDVVNINKLEVGGATKIKLGDGTNFLSIDDSTFRGTFALATGLGEDNVRIESADARTLATTFQKAATLNLGAGVDNLLLAGGSPFAPRTVVWSTITVQSAGVFSTGTAGPVLFPFGGSIRQTP